VSAATATSNDGRMTLVEHLVELRQRLFRAALAIAIASVVGFWLSEHILNWLNTYYSNSIHDPNARLVFFSPIEGFSNKLRIAGYVGLFGSSPVWLWQAWKFITPGLTGREKKYAVPFLVSSVLLFLFGAAIGLLTLPAGLSFLNGVAGKSQQSLYSTDKFLSFVSLVILAFGFSFLFPVVLVFLQLVNLVKPQQLLKQWRYAIVIIFVIAAVITPSQDPYTLFGMAGPMVVFYFGSILVGRLAKK
jgi:sec-independent protein translocase protein TatC